jgi:Integrase core domain
MLTSLSIPRQSGRRNRWSKPFQCLLRDREHVYGVHFRQRVHNMGIEEVVIAPQSPWQNPYVERLIGSIRRECLDHLVVLNIPSAILSVGGTSLVYLLSTFVAGS